MPETDGTLVKFARQNTGGYGALGVADTDAHAIDAASPLAASELAWTSFLFTTDTVFTELVASNATKCPVTGLTAVTFPAGSTLYTNATSFTLASGECVAYRGPRL